LKASAIATTARHCPIGIWYFRPKNTMTIETTWPTMPSDLMKTSVRRRMPELAALLNADIRFVENAGRGCVPVLAVPAKSGWSVAILGPLS
jgi:hypothetical protein